jgi:LysR family transcriptional regulator, glycine cleavage system transcriptional activator
MGRDLWLGSVLIEAARTWFDCLAGASALSCRPVKPRHSPKSPEPVKKLPPLEAVRMFEAVARLGSTVAAAKELHLTHGAVSRRVRSLEDHLGTALLARGPGGRLVPTEAGMRFAEAAQRALGTLAEAAEATGRNETRQRAVRINTTSSFASLWLIPRLNRFRARHPAFEAWISESQTLIEPGLLTNIDVAIRSGNGPWPGVKAERLMQAPAIAVCTPKLAAKLSTLSALAKVTLLQDEDPALSWPHWIAAAGLGHPAWASRGPRLAASVLLLQAAAAGDGVALVPACLAEGHFANGTLVAPFEVKLEGAVSYWLVRPQRGLSSAAVRAFCAWLRTEARDEA